MMEFNFCVKDKSLVTNEEYEQLDWLRFKDGYIWPAFQDYDGYVVLAKDENENIVGWSFVFLRPRNELKTFYIYVRKDWEYIMIK
jgi:deferrochelatase/peroxidase EfeB